MSNDCSLRFRTGVEERFEGPPIRCPHCGGEAFVMSRIADPRHVGGEIRTFECVSCERETEMRLQGEP